MCHCGENHQEDNRQTHAEQASTIGLELFSIVIHIVIKCFFATVLCKC